MDSDVTRRAIHAVAELVLAGPQYRRSQTIRLHVTPRGVATVTEPEVSIVGATVTCGDVSVPIDGMTCAGIAAAIGMQPSDLADVYSDVTGVDPNDVLHADTAHAARLDAAFAAGAAALVQFAPSASPVVWPEHFDVGISVDEVNYGVSPGDGYLAEPYAYVGPFVVPEGEFWNAPFGATLVLGSEPDAAGIVAFFAEGQRQAHR